MPLTEFLLLGETSTSITKGRMAAWAGGWLSDGVFAGHAPGPGFEPWYIIGTEQNRNPESGVMSLRRVPDCLQFRNLRLRSMTLGPRDTKMNDTPPVFEEFEL